LRATDHKSGRAPSSFERIGGGEKLQPILYAMALAALFPQREVRGGRLYYCTRKAGFAEYEVRLDEGAKKALDQVLNAIDSSIRDGFFPPAPRELPGSWGKSTSACEYCDYRAICGAAERERTSAKEGQRLAELTSIRRQR
jgi:ATP-dependent helicase/nuclease subunit B